MEIKLGGKLGGIALVSNEDYDNVSKYSWHKDNYGYTRTSINGKNTAMHRFIMNPINNEIVDHINHNKLDNRRENLRIFDEVHKNAGNRQLKENKSSKYRGVYWKKNKKKFHSEITINHKCYYLGMFADEIIAAETIDKFILHQKIDYIDLNFPEKKDKYLTENYKPPDEKKEKEFTGIAKYNDRYKSMISIKNKTITLLISDDPIKCAEEYDRYIVANNIPFRKLNFPDKYPNYNPNVIKTKFEKINDTLIKLSSNQKIDKQIIIDMADYDMVKYSACFINKTSGYPMICVNGKTLLLSRYLMNECNPKIYVDHVDGNILNNSKTNLRLSNARQNGQNKSKSIVSKTTSKYLGMYYSERDGIWITTINKDGKCIFRYRNKDETITAKKRDLHILDNPHLHYKLNFEWDENEIKIWKEYFSIFN